MPRKDTLPADEQQPVRIETRIDAAHVRGKTEPKAMPSQQLQSVGTAVESRISGTQMQAQADQLASYLRTRQQNVDQREAQINAQLAVLDRDARRERLAQDQRDDVLAKREEALSAKERDLEGRLAALSAAEESVKETQAKAEVEIEQERRALRHREKTQVASKQETDEQLGKREQALQHAERWFREQQDDHRHTIEEFENYSRRTENELLYQRQQADAYRAAALELVRRRQDGVERQRASLEAREKQWERAVSRPSAASLRLEKTLRQEEAAQKARKAQLDEAELKLAEAQVKTHQLHEQMRCERRLARDELKGERRRLALEHRGAAAELQKKRDALARRSAYVDNCQAKLTELRAELAEMHRETLDVRLATEELWVQLSGTTPPAVLAESLTALRSRLSRHYRETEADLNRQKESLDSARAEIAQQLEAVQQRKQEVDGWAQQREEDLHQQAKRLRDREVELQQREADLADTVHLRESERLAFEAEIQQLQRRLDELECVAIPVGA